MKLRNPFTQKTRELFAECWHCCVCGQNRWDAIHHILGRKSNSPLNAAPIHNQKCHIGNGKLDSFDMRSKLLRQTLEYLLSIGYVLTEEDEQFKSQHSQYYE